MGDDQLIEKIKAELLATTFAEWSDSDQQHALTAFEAIMKMDTDKADQFVEELANLIAYTKQGVSNS